MLFAQSRLSEASALVNLDRLDEARRAAGTVQAARGEAEALQRQAEALRQEVAASERQRQDLARQNFISGSALDTAEARYNKARAQIDTLKAHRGKKGREIANILQMVLQEILESGLMSIVSSPLKLEAYPLIVFPWDDQGLIGALDYADAPSDTFMIVATDDGEPALTAFTTVRVSVNDSNNHAPEFDAANYTAVVPAHVSPDSPHTKHL